MAWALPARKYQQLMRTLQNFWKKMLKRRGACGKSRSCSTFEKEDIVVFEIVLRSHRTVPPATR
ncbi:hypothetical protein M413DRAFT_448186 [Hebeloma cylindrosporum]|uniref:Uncharacterized protein n=1 Tax=Hebeloma cylindrosporum TaxID=76867 RepID=A0A0C2XJC6_HEBCY|nr:hypothetical protein M413DRAFT_448186 [Hebeloma cylindrosporum h7]